MNGEQYCNHIANLGSDKQQQAGEAMYKMHREQMQKDQKPHNFMFVVLFLVITVGAALKYKGII